MTLRDIVILGKVLGFKSNDVKTNVDESDARYSAYKEENGICIRIANHRNKLKTWLNNFKGKQFPKRCISIVFLSNNKMNQQPNCDLPSDVNFVVDEFVYNMDNIDWNIVKNQIKGDIQNTFKTGYYANNPIESIEGGEGHKSIKIQSSKRR